MAFPRRRLAPEARRLEILEAAERLLRRDGLNVRVEDIAAEAHAAKGTFFVCFATWNDLLDAIRVRQGAVYRELTAFCASPGEITDWNGVLPELARTLVDFILAMEGLHDVLFHSAFTMARPLAPEQRPAAQIAAILRAGVTAGRFIPVDPEPTANLIFTMIHQTADAIAAGGERERWLEALHILLCRIVGTQPWENAP